MGKKHLVKKPFQLTEEEWEVLQELCAFHKKSRHRLLGDWILTAKKESK